MKILLKIILALYLFSFTACWSVETPDTSNKSNSANVPNTATVVNETTAANTVNSVNSVNQSSKTIPVKSPMSPTETLKELSSASRTKDTEAVKKTLSKNSINLIQLSAANQKKSLDELLRSDAGTLFVPLPELGREEINGDTATLEVKNKLGKWDKVPFVLENGEWKVAIDKYLLE